MRRAIHICSGDQSSEALVDHWLRGGDFAVDRFEDVYSACAHLVRNPDSPPDLVVVGASWLTQDELAIIGYLEQTWPSAPLVVYGLPDDADSVAESEPAFVCRSTAELRSLLERSPAELALSAADSADVPLDSNERDDLPTETSAAADAHDGGRALPIVPTTTVEPESNERRDALDEVELTREELAALLEDSER